MKSILIKDTTREEREQIVNESLGNVYGGCDDCAVGIIDMYDDYIECRKELREVNAAFKANYESGFCDDEKVGCAYVRN